MSERGKGKSPHTKDRAKDDEAPPEKRKATFVEAGKGPRPPPATVTPLQLARLAQCSRQHITNLLASKEIKGVRFGSLWRIPLPEAERLIGQAILSVD